MNRARGSCDREPSFALPPQVNNSMSTNECPSTPPNISQNIQSLSINSTPYAQGPGSHTSYHSQHLQTDYKPYLREDLKYQYSILLDEFLIHILKVKRSELEQEAAEYVKSQPAADSALDREVTDYIGSLGLHKTRRYHPFATLA